MSKAAKKTSDKISDAQNEVFEKHALERDRIDLKEQVQYSIRRNLEVLVNIWKSGLAHNDTIKNLVAEKVESHVKLLEPASEPTI